MGSRFARTWARQSASLRARAQRALNQARLPDTCLGARLEIDGPAARFQFRIALLVGGQQGGAFGFRYVVAQRPQHREGIVGPAGALRRLLQQVQRLLLLGGGARQPFRRQHQQIQHQEGEQAKRDFFSHRGDPRNFWTSLAYAKKCRERPGSFQTLRSCKC